MITHHTVRSTIAERRECESATEIGQAVLDLIENHKKCDHYSDGKITLEVIQVITIPPPPSDCLAGRVESATPAGADGGDVVFQVGAPAPDGGAWGSFVFKGAEGDEILRIDQDGAVLVSGRKVATGDRLVYESFKHWLAQSVANLGKGCTVNARPEICLTKPELCLAHDSYGACCVLDAGHDGDHKLGARELGDRSGIPSAVDDNPPTAAEIDATIKRRQKERRSDLDGV